MEREQETGEKEPVIKQLLISLVWLCFGLFKLAAIVFIVTSVFKLIHGQLIPSSLSMAFSVISFSMGVFTSKIYEGL